MAPSKKGGRFLPRNFRFCLFVIFLTCPLFYALWRSNGLGSRKVVKDGAALQFLELCVNPTEISRQLFAGKGPLPRKGKNLDKIVQILGVPFFS